MQLSEGRSPAHHVFVAEVLGFRALSRAKFLRGWMFSF